MSTKDMRIIDLRIKGGEYKEYSIMSMNGLSTKKNMYIIFYPIDIF